MKISCTQENLNQGLLIVSHVANKNSNLPILANILIKSSDKLLTFSATNLEIGVTAQIRGKVEEDGEFSVDARLLSEYVSLLPKERVDLFLDDDSLKIQCQKQKTSIKGQPASEFPLIPKIKKENPYIIKAKELKEAIGSVVFAASNSESRPEISGIFINFKNSELILAATDSYRLAEKKIKILDNKNQEERSVIVPVKTIQEISRILSVFKDDISLENIENIEIYLSNNQIMFSYNSVDLISRLIEGQYPDYTQIIPTEHKTQTKLNVSNLVKLVKTSSLFTKSGIYDVKIEFNSDSKEVIVASSSAQTGENIAALEAEITGEDNNIVLNYRYLLDGLQNLGADEAMIEINTSNNPCVLKPAGRDDYVYIIMPIKQ